jgi:hypothetical protein
MYSPKPAFVWLMTEKGRKYLQCAKTWLIDGTFKSCPCGYSQLVTVMAAITSGGNEYYIPCAHVLVEEKNAECYESILRNIIVSMYEKNDSRNAPPKVALKNIMIDFDEAEKNGFKKALGQCGMPDVKISGCLFHYGQALWRFFHKTYGKGATAVQKMMLQVYLWLPYFQKQSDISATLERIKQTAICREFYDYFEKQWSPRIDWWWVGHELCPITTNSAIESFHGRLNKSIGHPHPPFQDLNRILFDMDNCQMGREETGQPGTGGTKPRKLDVFLNHRSYIEGVINRFLDKQTNKPKDMQPSGGTKAKSAETKNKANDGTRQASTMSMAGVCQAAEQSQEAAAEVLEEVDGNENVIDFLCADLFDKSQVDEPVFSRERIQNYFTGKGLLK